MASLIKGRNFLFNLAGQTSHLDSMTDPLTDLNINAAAQLHILEVLTAAGRSASRAPACRAPRRSSLRAGYP
jgi:hypothetical protein